MSNRPCLLLTIVLVLAFATLLRAQESQPELLPTRDVDISYDVTRLGQPPIIERRRWSTSEHLQRVDGSDKSSTIFDRKKGEFTLLNRKSRTYRKFEGSPRMPMAPVRGTALKRGGKSRLAGLHCVDWSGTDGDETRTWCLTPDGVLLRLVIDGKTIIQARSVYYGLQSADLFEDSTKLRAGDCAGRWLGPVRSVRPLNPSYGKVCPAQRCGDVMDVTAIAASVIARLSEAVYVHCAKSE